MAVTTRSVWMWTFATPLVVGVLAAIWGGRLVGVAAGSGAAAGCVLQLMACLAYARALAGRPEDVSPTAASERALRALGKAAAIRVFGGVLVIVAATQVEGFELWPFVIGFVLGYGLLEVAVGRWLIATER